MSVGQLSAVLICVQIAQLINQLKSGCNFGATFFGDKKRKDILLIQKGQLENYPRIYILFYIFV